MHQRREVWSIVALSLVLAALPVATWAEDGYDLWLRYAPIESAPLRAAYRQAIVGVVVQQSPGTATIVSTELARGLRGLLGVRGAGVDVGHRRRRAGRRHRCVADRVGPWLGRRPEEPGAGGVRHPPRARRRQARARGRLPRRPRRALRHVPPAAAALHRRIDRAARRPREAAPPAPAAQSLGQPGRIDRARLRRGLPLEVGGAARDDRSAAARLRACERVARPERHRSQQRERQRAVAHRRVHRQGRRHRRHAPALRPEGVPVRQLRRAAHDRRADHRRPARPGRAALVEGQGG